MLVVLNNQLNSQQLRETHRLSILSWTSSSTGN